MKNKTQSIRQWLATAAVASIATLAVAQTWDFTTVGNTDIANLAADTEAWEHEATSSNDRYKNIGTYDNEPLTANGEELALTQGLLFTASSSDAIRIDVKNKRLAMNKTTTITIGDVAAGSTITVRCKTSSSSASRGLNVTNVTPTSGYFNSTATEEQTNVGTVDADGDVTLTNTGGLYVYSISVSSGSGQGSAGGADCAFDAAFDPSRRQVQLKMLSNEVKFYNAEDLDGISIDREEGSVDVHPKGVDSFDRFTKTVKNISFSKAQEQGGGADIEAGGVELTRADGWFETAYAEWTADEAVGTYRVYVKGGPYADFTRVDSMLVRNYGSYGRVDVVGLPAGSDYVLKVVPVVDGVEDDAASSTASNITVAGYDRSGFAFKDYAEGIGAYKSDGTLKDDARVIYVTSSTAKTVTLDVVTSSKGSEQTFTGMQAIINAYQKGYETRPLCVRLIGMITDSDMDDLLSSAEGLQVKGKNNTTPMNITIEGIGEDATIWGFGILMRNAVSVELRNFAIMLCMDDCVSVDTNNKNCWIHNLDLYYGQTGGDSDQEKGDGTIDIKGKSTCITVAYNHFVDCGKSMLCGMKSETTDCLIDYHHNWFDHSDSRHPRVRTMTVHVWNNYYDGCSKYGVGATMGSSVFVENNFFRATKKPMLISKQGTDAEGTGTFSGEDGGMIKSYGNVYAEVGASGTYIPVSQASSATDFDCYEAADRNEQVAGDYVTLSGGTAYNNFDTDPSIIYEYTPTAATDVPATVTGYYGAGRLNKGDFGWTFDNSTDDADYGVITQLKSALEQYTSKLVGIY